MTLTTLALLALSVLCTLLVAAVGIACVVIGQLSLIVDSIFRGITKR
jgi:predicted Co/Zn/Cd cation transporter (cation efflux family)